MRIRFLGAARQVTGSCYHLLTGQTQLLVDCGMQQGEAAENDFPFAFQPSEIACLFLTHSHIDHSGLIPKLVREGFKGTIITTAATADLTRIMLHDSAHIQEKDAEWKTKKALRQGRNEVFEPLYSVKEADDAMQFFMKKEYGEIGRLGKGLRYRFLDAGHILGSGTFEPLLSRDCDREEDRLFGRHRQERQSHHCEPRVCDVRGLRSDGIHLRQPRAQGDEGKHRRTGRGHKGYLQKRGQCDHAHVRCGEDPGTCSTSSADSSVKNGSLLRTCSSTAPLQTKPRRSTSRTRRTITTTNGASPR